MLYITKQGRYFVLGDTMTNYVLCWSKNKKRLTDLKRIIEAGDNARIIPLPVEVK